MAMNMGGSPPSAYRITWFKVTAPPCAMALGSAVMGSSGSGFGARALYLGDTVYRIHGTNQPQTIGHAVAALSLSGCNSAPPLRPQYKSRLMRHRFRCPSLNFRRNLGADSPLGIPRGMNQLWNRGGIQYAPPMN
jgi:hypothetical protein